MVTPENLRQPPDGARFEQSGDGFKISVSTRSYSWLLFTPIACFWSSLLFIFSWGIFFHDMDVETRLILFLFLIPFYLMGLFLWGVVLISVGGKIVVEVDGDFGTVFKGLGVIGWKRKFDWARVEKIYISKYYYNARTGMGGYKQQVALEGEKVTTFARGVNPKRLRFMLIALRLMNRNKV